MWMVRLTKSNFWIFQYLCILFPFHHRGYNWDANLCAWVQNPPWISINYGNGSKTNEIDTTVGDNFTYFDQIPSFLRNSTKFKVNGRDDVLLKILAKQMNFTFRYVDVSKEFPHRNDTQPAQLGLKMIIDRVSDNDVAWMKGLLVSLTSYINFTTSGVPFSLRQHFRKEEKKKLKLFPNSSSIFTESIDFLRRHCCDKRNAARRRILILHAARLGRFSHPRAIAPQRSLCTSLSLPSERLSVTCRNHCHSGTDPLSHHSGARACDGETEVEDEEASSKSKIDDIIACLILRYYLHTWDVRRQQEGQTSSWEAAAKKKRRKPVCR